MVDKTQVYTCDDGAQSVSYFPPAILLPDRIASGITDRSYMLVPQSGLLTILGALVGGLGLPVFATHSWAAWRYMGTPSKSHSY